jgi:hypothetical protein
VERGQHLKIKESLSSGVSSLVEALAGGKAAFIQGIQGEYEKLTWKMLKAWIPGKLSAGTCVDTFCEFDKNHGLRSAGSRLLASVAPVALRHALRLVGPFGENPLITGLLDGIFGEFITGDEVTVQILNTEEKVSESSDSLNTDDHR